MPRRVKKRRKVQTDDGVSILWVTNWKGFYPTPVTQPLVSWRTTTLQDKPSYTNQFFKIASLSSLLRSRFSEETSLSINHGGFQTAWMQREGGGRLKNCLFSMLLDERESGASKPRRKHPIFNLREKEFEPIGVTRKPFHCEHYIGLSNFLPMIDRSILSQFTVGLRKKGDKKENISLGRSDEGGAVLFLRREIVGG